MTKHDYKSKTNLIHSNLTQFNIAFPLLDLLREIITQILSVRAHKTVTEIKAVETIIHKS